MRAILLNVFIHTELEADIPGDLNSIYAAVDASSEGFDAVQDIQSIRVLGGNYLWFDRDGFNKDGLPCFQLDGYDGYIPGNAVILGVDSLGANYDANIGLGDIHGLTVWTPTKYTTGTRDAPDTDPLLVVVELGDPILRDVP
jgi:hypothetical protein